jgi:hypothetical protein
MPQPGEVEALARALLALYERSWQRITTDEAHLLANWVGWRRSERLARLRALRATVEALMDRADEQALRFTQQGLPEAYLLGAAAAGVGITPWTQVDLDALAVLSRDTYTALLDATTFVRESAKDLIRTLAKAHLADKLIRGQTAVQAGRDLAGELEGRGIAAVVYKDGSRHGLSEYAQMLARTKSAEAYSVGTLNQTEEAGVRYVEVFDGVGCGWLGHNDPEKANGSIRTVEQARSAPISHPNCRRAFGARPDVKTAAEARRARPSVSPAQQADQAAAEARRALGVAASASERAFQQAVGRRADALLSDESSRVRSVAHARTLARRHATLARRQRAVTRAG